MGTKGKKVIRAIDRITDAILMIFFALCLVLGLYIAYDSYYVYTQASSDRMSGFKPAVAEGENIDTGVLKELSKDVVGWLTIDGTSIDYPVMQGGSNTDYLNKDPYGDFSLSGSIFVDSANAGDFTDSYSLIYGHHMERGFMFGALDDYRDEAFGNTHTTGRIITVDGRVIELQLCAVINALTTEGIIFDVRYANRNIEGLIEYINNNKIYVRDVEIDGVRLYALSTCTSSTSQERLIVLFREVNG